jgi:Tfp pilus assembly protein PilX
MNRMRAILRDERGVALIVALVALVALSALVVAFLAVGAYEPQISRNLVDATRARYLAEAGLEAAYDTLRTSTNWASLVSGSTAACSSTVNDATQSGSGNLVGSADSTLSGLTSASGTYTVRIRNDCRIADAMLTGVNAEPDATEKNDRVILTSTGTLPGSLTRRTITVVVAGVALNLLNPSAPPGGQINAALSFPGFESDTKFTGNAFDVDGRNHDLNDNLLTTGQSVLGISVGPENQFVPAGGPVMQHETTVQNSLTSVQKDNVNGMDQSSSSSNTIGNATIAAGLLTSQAITDFVSAVKSSADITINSTPSSPASFNNIGSSCGGNQAATDCWGTSANPKIVYVKGTLDTTSAFNALKIAGNSTGFGILIVEDGDFTISGNFAWEGPIIVTGGYVGVGILGGGNQQVLGALISNETATNEASGFFEGVVQGNAKVHYSRAALDKAQALLETKIPGLSGSSAYVKVNMYNFQEQ